MSAPAALAISKLFYPETEKSKTTVNDLQDMEKRYVFIIIENLFFSFVNRVLEISITYN